MSIRSVPNFSPALKPHAEWVDQNVGNKDGQLSTEELETYKQKFPDATMYEPLKGELNQATGAPPVANTTTATGGAVNVAGGNGVLGFLLNKAGATPAGGTTAASVSTVKQSLPLDALTKIGASSAGEVFQLDSDSVATMSVRARQVVHPTHGPGTELSMRLTPKESMELSVAFGGGSLAGAQLAPFQLEKAEFKDGATVMATDAAYQPQKGYSGALQAHRVDEPGKFTIEYVPPKDNPQAYRDRLRIRVFGKTDAERKANLDSALTRLQNTALVADADKLQNERLLRLSVMRMVDPKRAEELGANLAALDTAALDAELKARGVDEQRMKGVHTEEVFPGQMTPVDPALGEQYAQLGVRAVMVGVREVDFAAKILSSDGLMSSLERYGRGIHKAGASLTADEASGGAEFAFTRMVTPKAVASSASISSSYGAGAVQLLSVGDEMKKLLSRTDWHAYASDSYGVTVSKSQAQDDPLAKSEMDKRQAKFSERPVLGDLVAQINGDKPAPGVYGNGSFATSNEACFKSGVAARAWTHAVVQNDTAKQQLIKALTDQGVTQLGGQPLDKAVLVAQNWKQVSDALAWPG
ncbi:MAG: hypothetical protein HY904_26160 [Deltaproteobacteria bacterium]|nr:hypothetical protein [Deltaproteobacteria bacterium]